ncbi:unnamed protein product [Pylaiella littoralis]
MPNLFLVLQSPTHVSPAEAEGGPDWLPLAVMEALDACEAVPPAIVSCVPPVVTPSSLSSSSQSSPSPSSSPSSLQQLSFEAEVLDTPLLNVWRQEARRHFQENGLSEPLAVHHTEWCPSTQDVKVAMNLELDGAWVASATAPGGERWDTSKLVVLDGLVDEDLCRDLLDLVTEPGWATKTTAPAETPSLSLQSGSSNGNGNEGGGTIREGPPTSKWERGLVDVDEEDGGEDGEEEEEEEEEGGGGGGGGRGAGPGSWGLTEDAMEWLCREGEHPAIVELHSRLCKLYPDFLISHMPEAVMGASTARMVANAPVYGDRFSWHIDADPAVFPPSPWRDHFGTYTNREPGMPLFATLLLYLDQDWRREWDAETLFLDPVSGTGAFVRPRIGRAVVMDQDITHRISTPSQTAARPRYSLALKLIFFSREHGHYGFPPPTITTFSSSTATAPAAAAAVTATSPGHPLPPPLLPEELCISSLSALRAKGSGKAGSVRFGSSSASSLSPRAGESAASSSLGTNHPLTTPSTSSLGDHAADNEEGRGTGDGRSSGLGVAVEGGGGAVEVCGGGIGGDGSPSSLSSSTNPSAAGGPLVEVKPVGVKGMGLFSTRRIAKGVVVGFYSGETLTTEQLDDRYPNFEGSDYVMQLGPDRYLDARDPEKSSIARYANHSGHPNLVVELRPVGDCDNDATGGADAAVITGVAVAGVPAKEGVALTTLRDVEEGEELTFDYGEEYFDGDDDEGNVIEDGEEMKNLLGSVDWGSNPLST